MFVALEFGDTCPLGGVFFDVPPLVPRERNALWVEGPFSAGTGRTDEKKSRRCSSQMCFFVYDVSLFE